MEQRIIKLAEVYCFGRTKNSFCYLYNDKDENILLGSIVKVDFCKKKSFGIVLNIISADIFLDKQNNECIKFTKKDIKISKIKTIEEIVYKNFLSKDFLSFLRKMSYYNIIELERVLQLVVPSFWINKKREIKCDIDNKTIKQKENCSDIILTEEQSNIASKIYNKKIEQGFNVAVLRGVMGSGKTYIFLEVINKIFSLDKTSQALIMVPEIALTGQLIDLITRFCHFKPIIWHSSVGISKKKKNYEMIINGTARIIISARSGLFLPYKNLQIIVVDEEHDQSYKQDEIPCYQARDMAVLRAKCENIQIILSSATPSIETLNNILEKKYDIYNINTQFFNIKPPKIVIV